MDESAVRVAVACLNVCAAIAFLGLVIPLCAFQAFILSVS
jgi:hypothetical protein